MTGGAEDEFERLLKYFSSKSDKYEVHGMFPRGDRSEIYATYCSKVGYYRYGHLPVINEGVKQYLKYLAKFPIQFFQLIRFAWGQKYDITAVNVVVLLWPVIAMKLLGSKIIVFVREDIQPVFLRTLVYRLYSKICSFMIPNSDTKAKEITKVSGYHNVKRIYPAIDEISAAGPELLKEKIGDKLYSLITEENQFRFLNPARILHKKNQALILRALCEIKKTGKQIPQIVFLGYFDRSDPYMRDILSFIDSNSLQPYCLFLGELERKFLYEIYPLMDSVLQTSFSEGMPIVMVESFRFGKPFISTKVGGIPEVIENGESGLLVEFDENKVAEAMMSIMNDDLLYRKISLTAMTIYKKYFELNSVLHETETVFKEVMKSGK